MVPEMQRMMRNGLLLLAAIFVASCGNCTTDSENQPPTVVVNGAPTGNFVVGDTVNIGIDASDPEGGSLSFDWDFKPKNVQWTVEERATFLTGDSTATFQWDPLASDATNDVPIQLIFIVEDDAGKVTEKVVTVNVVPGNGVPIFRSNASQLYDPRTGEPVRFEVRVSDNDSSQVQLTIDEASKPGGSKFNQMMPFSGIFEWTPTADQLERRVHNVTFIANDMVNPPVPFKVTIVIRTASQVVIDRDQTTKQCPDAAIIQHTAIGPQRKNVDPYVIEATLSDPSYDTMTVYYTYSVAQSYGGVFDPDEPGMNSAPMTSNGGGTWSAEILPQLSDINLEDGAITYYYQICAVNSQTGDEVCSPSSGDQQLWHTFIAYLPDFTECRDDFVSRVTPNDTFETANRTTESWSGYRACSGAPDFHSVTLRPGESALFAAVYPQDANITFTAYDGSRAPIPMKSSTCTGMSTVEFSVPDTGTMTTFYVETVGDEVAYVVKSSIAGNPSECADAGFEPNETAASATPLTPGQTVNAEICSENDIDVYAIDLQAGQQITATAMFSNASGNLDMTLYAPSQAAEITRSGTGVKFTFTRDDVEVLEYTAEEAGTYYLLVFNNEPTANPYSLTATISDAPACQDTDSYSGTSANHTRQTAAILSSGEDVQVPGLQVCPGSPDWYRRVEFAGEYVFGVIDVTSGNVADVQVQVFDEANDVVGAGVVVGNTVEFDFTPQAMGTHYIKVETTARVEYDMGILR